MKAIVPMSAAVFIASRIVEPARVIAPPSADDGFAEKINAAYVFCLNGRRSMDNRQRGDARLVCGAQKRFPELLRGNVSTDGVDAGFDGDHIFLAIIERPVPDQQVCGVAERTHDGVRFPTAQNQPDRRECR
ncbi:hypothetical protein J2X71_005661 [Rhizobium sp. 1399]|nr:hypothetical protein [Rhizobium sp. 1399]